MIDQNFNITLSPEKDFRVRARYSSLRTAKLFLPREIAMQLYRDGLIPAAVGRNDAGKSFLIIELGEI